MATIRSLSYWLQHPEKGKVFPHPVPPSGFTLPGCSHVYAGRQFNSEKLIMELRPSLPAYVDAYRECGILSELGQLSDLVYTHLSALAL